MTDDMENCAKPTLKDLSDCDEFYILDTRSVVGNCAMWWAPEGRGYVCSLSDAGVYTREEAYGKRESDVPVPRALAEAFVVRHVRVDQLDDSMSLRPGRDSFEARMNEASAWHRENNRRKIRVR